MAAERGGFGPLPDFRRSRCNVRSLRGTSCQTHTIGVETRSGTQMRQILSVLVLFTTLALPAPAAAQHPAAGSHAGAQTAVAAGYDDLKWQAIIPELGDDSPQIAILRVDPSTQATQLLIRIPKQMHVPMHWHSANETHTVIKGRWVFEHEGQRHELGAGGFNYLPARMHHQAWASDDALVFITVDGAWDTNWVNGPPTKANLGQRPPSR
jgi:quercetin dioxygenase-like cupin family protein